MVKASSFNRHRRICCGSAGIRIRIFAMTTVPVPALRYHERSASKSVSGAFGRNLWNAV